MSVFQSQQPELDLDKAKELGARLKAARETQRLSAREMADTLLLSRAQVEGLESGDGGCFYGARLFAQSAEKYADRMGLADVGHGELLIEPNQRIEEAASEAPSAGRTVDNPPKVVNQARTASGRQRSPRAWLVLLIVLLIALAGYQMNLFPFMVTNESQGVASEDAPRSVAPAVTQPEPKPVLAQRSEVGSTAPEQKPVAGASPIATGSLRLSFEGDSWVQIVENQGQKRDRIYRHGETLTIDTAKLQALIIGNAAAVRVVSTKGDVNLAPYINRGGKVARIVGPAIGSLAE